MKIVLNMIVAACALWSVAASAQSYPNRETRLEREQKGLKGLSPQLSGKYAKAA